MARKTHKYSKKNQERRSAIMSVVRAYLNMDSLEEYQDWCINQGYSTNLNKSQNEVYREYGKYKQREAFRAMKKINSRRNFKTVLQMMYSKELIYDELTSDSLRTIYDAFYATKKPDLLRDTFLFLAERSNILENVDYIESVEVMMRYSESWLNPVKDWKPKSKNVHRQFRSFVRYLFAKYDIPEFMDSVWKHGVKTDIKWYIHLGLGNNICTAKCLPVKLTKKMAHYYLTAPDYYSARAAFRWAQVIAIGGNKVTADAVSETRLGREFVDDEFWLTVIQFFVNNPMLDRVHYGPIVDYIFNKKYENRGAGNQLLDDCEVGGEQPDFSMKGRTPVSLLRQVHEWHRQLGRVANSGNLKWKSSGITGLHLVEKGETARDRKVWTIRELLSSKELFVEGYIQNHCVATYDYSCKEGESSIWTMEVYKEKNKFKLLTIEVDNGTKTIIQVRGRHNRIAYDHEVELLKRWSAKAKLKIDIYVTDDV